MPVQKMSVWERLHQKTPGNVPFTSRKTDTQRSNSSGVKRLLNQTDSRYGKTEKRRTERVICHKRANSNGEMVGRLFNTGMGCSPCRKLEVDVKRPKFGFEPIKGTQKHHNTIRDHTLKNGKLNIFDQNQTPYEPLMRKKLILRTMAVSLQTWKMKMSFANKLQWQFQKA